MFFKLVLRNGSRSRKENGLFFASLLVSIVAFYIILSLSHQDVMLFLKKMESDAVDKLLLVIPAFYGLTLCILFFLIYYASKFQLERRRHEFGVYLMMGMCRSRLFGMLLAEDLSTSLAALLIGLPVAVLLSEMISLITARVVGLGIIGHQVSFSFQAVLWTAGGFLLIKLAAFLVLSGRIARQEIGSLLVDTPEGTKRQLPAAVYALAFSAGVLCLGNAYYRAITGIAWISIKKMAFTLTLGVAGTLLLFFGLRFVMNLFAGSGKMHGKLSVFNFRQIQETVIRRSSTLAVSSLLILAALCCFGAGAAIACYYGQSETRVLDYTFKEDENSIDIRDALIRNHLDSRFSHLIEIRQGHIRTTEDYDHALEMDSVMDALEQLPQSEGRENLRNNFAYMSYPALISLSGYNELLSAAGLSCLELQKNEAAVYMDQDIVTDEMTGIMNQVLETKPAVQLDGQDFYLKGRVQTTSIVTDRAITLSFALILTDEVFDWFTQGDYSVYLSGILNPSVTEHTSLLNAISQVNEELDEAGISYESYLQNMGRQLFYVVAASYITIYLAVIFLIIANTIIGVQFLMGQQKSGKRYRTLVRLGATYETLYRSAGKQINWYFGIPTAVAVISSLFGVRALFTVLLSSDLRGKTAELLWISAAMILLLAVIEWIYMAAVKKSSSRYLLTLLEPEREE